MTAPTAFRERRHTSNMPSLTAIADHWREDSGATFPDLPTAVIGWGEPFCFRCGWLVPDAGDSGADSWASAAGWLERAHLQDSMSGGSDEAENIVPLCSICHRSMPDFADSRTDAIGWVKAAGHDSSPAWWQIVTDTKWGGERFIAFPGRLVFMNCFVQVAEQQERRRTAGQLAEAGDLVGACRSLRLAGLSDESAREVMSA